MSEQWDVLEAVALGVSAIGVESYTVGQVMGRNAWKTALSYQNVCSFARAHRIPLVISRPDDLKRRFLGSNKGGKVGVMGKVLEAVDGLAEELEAFSPTKWEHLADAVAHGLMALESIR